MLNLDQIEDSVVAEMVDFENQEFVNSFGFLFSSFYQNSILVIYVLIESQSQKLGSQIDSEIYGWFLLLFQLHLQFRQLVEVGRNGVEERTLPVS